MERGVADQGTSQSLSLTPQEALLSYDPRDRRKAVSTTQVEELRPMSANQYFSSDFVELWEPSLLPSFGAKCRRAFFLNDFHVLLCGRRLILVHQSGDHLAFPPFEEALNDAYVEKVSHDCVLVIAAVASGVHMALVRQHGSQKANTVQNAFCPASSPVVRIHHLKKSLYGLCCSNCTVSSLSIELDDVDSPHPQLGVSIFASKQGFFQNMRDYVATKRYVHSFFNHYKGYLLTLSSTTVSLWMYRDEACLQLESMAGLQKGNAVAILPPPIDAQEADELIAVLVKDNGDRIDVNLAIKIGKRGSTHVLSLGTTRSLPSGATVTAVSFAAACDTSILLADQATSSLVLSTQCEPFCEPYHSNTVRVLSQVCAGKGICGLGVERRSSHGHNFLTFLVYCDDSKVGRLGRMPRGQLLKCQFAVSARNGIAALSLLEAEDRADVLLDAALCGLAASNVSECLEPLLVPEVLSVHAAELSCGARGILRNTMRNLNEISRLCSSFHYWRLPEELSQSRLRLEKCCAILDEVLNRGGWLEVPVRRPWRWSSKFEVTLDVLNGGGSSDAIRAAAINAQAELLQVLLSSLRQAVTIAGLYGLMLQNNTTYRFPGRLESKLWEEDPSEIQNALCRDLLALSDQTITAELVSSAHALPRRAQLAAQLQALVLEKPFEDVMAYIREYVCDINAADLLSYTSRLLTTHFPASPSQLLLWVCLYPHQPNVIIKIREMLKMMESPAELSGTLRTILTEPACNQDLRDVMVDEMQQYPLDDGCILALAQVVVDLHLNVDGAETLTGRFFAYVQLEAAGQTQLAAEKFGKLARTDVTAVPLGGRLLAIQHAVNLAPTDANRFTQFLLLLQQQLAKPVLKYLQSGKDLPLPRSTIESDLSQLQDNFLSENTLFELAGRYKTLGGCCIQLDVLAIHPDAAEPIVTKAIEGVLVFLDAVGLSATEAVLSVLKEYVGSFQSPLPLAPFVEFMTLHRVPPEAAIQVLEEGGVQLLDVFDTFMAMLDHYNKSSGFPAVAMVSALGQLVTRIDSNVQHIYAAYLLEYSRSLLQGDQRTASLSDVDEKTLLDVSEKMRHFSQRTHVAN